MSYSTGEINGKMLRIMCTVRFKILYLRVRFTRRIKSFLVEWEQNFFRASFTTLVLLTLLVPLTTAQVFVYYSDNTCADTNMLYAVQYSKSCSQWNTTHHYMGVTSGSVGCTMS